MKPSDQARASKTTQKLDTFADMLSLIMKISSDVIEVNHHEESWENIPLIIPRTAFTLEKKVLAINNWRQSIDKHIAFLLSGDAWNPLKELLEEQKVKEHDFENKTIEEIDKISVMISALRNAEQARIIQEKKSYVEPSYYEQLLKNKDGTTDIKQQNSLMELPDESKSPDSEEPRSYSLQHLKSIVHCLLDQSRLSKRVSSIENKLLLFENKVTEKINQKFEEMNQKCIAVDNRVTLVQEELREEGQRKGQDIMDFILKDVRRRVSETANSIASNSEAIDALTNQMKSINEFKRRIDERFDQTFQQNKCLTQTVEKKMLSFEQSLRDLSTIAEKDFAIFREKTEKDFSVIKKKTDEGLLQIKAEVLTLLEENVECYINKVDAMCAQTASSLAKVESETNIIVSDMKMEFSKIQKTIMTKHKNYEEALTAFSNRFDLYIKNKIEPAFSSEAKLHALEARQQEHADFISYSSFFNKNILKKLVYALQRYNMSDGKVAHSKADAEHKGSSEYNPVCLTEPQDQNSEIDISLQEIDHVKMLQTYSGWGRRAQSNARSRKDSGKAVYSPLQIDKSNIRGQEQLPMSNAFKLSKRNQSFEVEVHPGKEDRSAYNDVFHQRLETIRKALIEENTINQKYKEMQTSSIVDIHKIPKEKIPKTNFLNFYSNIDLIKVDSDAAKGRFSTNKFLDQSSSEFADGHLFSETIKNNNKKKL